MSDVKVPLRGCTRLYVTRYGGVGAQRGLTATFWIADNYLVGWLTFPFAIVEAICWLAFGD